jgi:4-amino-4-deoxy-L-arabinose transferase-like glycosyltransferase
MKAVQIASRWHIPLLLALIMTVALTLRLWGIGFGLPHRYHIDEPPYVLAALRIAQGDLAIVYPYNSPNIFQFALTLEYGLLYVIGRLTGAFASTGDVATLYQTDPTIFYLLARGTSAVAGTITVWLAYLSGKRLYGTRGGVFAAILLGTAFIHVRDSHYAVTDTLISLLVLACLFCSISYVGSGRLPTLALAGLVGGAAVGLKYLPAPILLAPALGILWRHAMPDVSRRWRLTATSLGILAASALAGFLAAFPALLLSPSLFRQHVTLALGQAANPLGNLMIDTAPAWLYYGQTLLWGLGVPLLIAASGGVGLALARRDPAQIIWAIATVGYFVGICLVNTYFARYALPLVAPLLVLAAGFLVFCSDYLYHRLQGRIPALAVSTLLVSITVIYPTIKAIRHDYLLVQTDTRTVAKNWIETNLPEGSRIVTQWFGPPLSVAGDPEPGATRVYDVVTLDPFVNEPSRYSVEDYRNSTADYIIVNGYNSHFRLTDPEANELRQQFYTSLDAQAALIAEFSPNHHLGEPPFVFDEIYGPAISLWQRERPGPTIKIYRISP